MGESLIMFAKLLLGNTITLICYYLILKTYYKRKEWAKNHGMIFLGVWIALLFGYTFGNLLALAPVNLACTFLGFIIPAFLFYEVDNLRGIAYFLFLVVIMCLAEIILGLSFNLRVVNLQANYDYLTMAYNVLMNLIQISSTVLICIGGNKESNKEFDKVTIYFMIVPIVSIIIMINDMIRYSFSKSFDPEAFSEVSVTITLINIVVLVIMENYTNLMKKHIYLNDRNQKLENESDILFMSTKAMKEQLAITEKAMENDRIMRHDRRHFEATLLTLLQEGKAQDAEYLLNERLKVEPRTVAKYCENSTVNATIMYYFLKAKEAGIKVASELNIPQDLHGIDELQFAITIGNLLENAIHACEVLPEADRYINIRVIYNQQLLVEIENPCNEEVTFDEAGYPFSDKKGHGVGTKSIRAFVENNDSVIKYTCEDCVFKVRMIV